MHKFEYLEIEKSFLDEIKSIFYNFWMDIIWWKNKNLIKIVDTSFKYCNQELRRVGCSEIGISVIVKHM